MSEKEIYSKDQNLLARFAKALSHPVRIYILEMLSKEECCYSGDLAEILPIARSTISQHLKELKDAGLISGNTEPPKIKYCLNRENWLKAKNLLTSFFDKSNNITC